MRGTGSHEFAVGLWRMSRFKKGWVSDIPEESGHARENAEALEL